MKKQRYKFDDEWIAAIALCDIPGLNIEKTIREHIEMDWNVDALFKNTPFEPVWILIRAEIARRKARNARARQRRRELRESHDAAISGISTKETSLSPARDKRPTVAGTVTVADQSVTTTKPVVASQPIKPHSSVRGKSPSSPFRHDTIGPRRQRPATKSSFANRFRGPGLSGTVRSTASD